MQRLLASTGFLAALFLASPAAQAQYQFEYGGRTIRIDPDRGTVSIPGVYDNSGRRNRKRDADRDHSKKPAVDQAKVDPNPQPVAAPPAPADQPPAAAVAPANIAPASAAPAPDTTTANVAPADSAAPAAAANPAPAPVQQDSAAPASPPPPVVATAPAAVPPPAPAPAPPPPAPVQQQAAIPVPAAAPSNTPLGLWLTEEKEGKVRIEQCGANLCGYSVDKSNQNGEQVLINMKPGKDAKWIGRILDPNSGSTYDSTIAMKGSNTLRVQGCAMGGMFCGGQTWTRVN